MTRLEQVIAVFASTVQTTGGMRRMGGNMDIAAGDFVNVWNGVILGWQRRHGRPLLTRSGGPGVILVWKDEGFAADCKISFCEISGNMLSIDEESQVSVVDDSYDGYFVAIDGNDVVVMARPWDPMNLLVISASWSDDPIIIDMAPYFGEEDWNGQWQVKCEKLENRKIYLRIIGRSSTVIFDVQYENGEKAGETLVGCASTEISSSLFETIDMHNTAMSSRTTTHSQQGDPVPDVIVGYSYWDQSSLLYNGTGSLAWSTPGSLPDGCGSFITDQPDWNVSESRYLQQYQDRVTPDLHFRLAFAVDKPYVDARTTVMMFSNQVIVYVITGHSGAVSLTYTGQGVTEYYFTEAECQAWSELHPGEFNWYYYEPTYMWMPVSTWMNPQFIGTWRSGTTFFVLPLQTICTYESMGINTSAYTQLTKHYTWDSTVYQRYANRAAMEAALPNISNGVLVHLSEWGGEGNKFYIKGSSSLELVYTAPDSDFGGIQLPQVHINAWSEVYSIESQEDPQMYDRHGPVENQQVTIRFDQTFTSLEKNITTEYENVNAAQGIETWEWNQNLGGGYTLVQIGNRNTAVSVFIKKNSTKVVDISN